MDLQQCDETNESHLDSHADTCAGGSNFVQLDDSPTRFVDVSPFSEEYEPMKNIPISTCATAWVCSETGQTRILVFHQMLFFGDKLSQSLLCPNQMRDHSDRSSGNEICGQAKRTDVQLLAKGDTVRRKHR